MGKDRRTMTAKLNGLPVKPGSKAAMLYKCGSPWTVVSEGDRMFLPSRIAQYERSSSYQRSFSGIDRKPASISLIFSSVSVSPFAALSVANIACKI